MRFVPRFRRGRAAPVGPSGQTETIVQEEAAGAPPVVEEEQVPPPPPPPQPTIWPWLLLLLLLVIGGLVAAWLLTRDNDHHKRSSPPTTVTTTRTVSPTPVVVPDVVGKPATTAVSILQRRGLKVRRVSVASRKAAGVVVDQNPTSGTRVVKGSIELIHVSRGVAQVPDVVGQNRATAVSAIRNAGLVPNAFTVSSTKPKGTVVAQLPSGGATVPRGSKVRLNLSNGRTTGGGGSPPPPPPPPPPTVAVPDVTGQPQEAAQRQLNSAGLKAGVVYVPSDQPEGTVVSQSPAGGATVRRGTRIQLNASLGPNAATQQTVPNMVGMSPQRATARLTSAGFTVQRLTRKVSVRSQDGVVVDEQPAGGRKAPGGSTVTIYVGRFAG
jgi:beta-lactam-binding protein with PASTA domain